MSVLIQRSMSDRRMNAKCWRWRTEDTNTQKYMGKMQETGELRWKYWVCWVRKFHSVSMGVYKINVCVFAWWGVVRELYLMVKSLVLGGEGKKQLSALVYSAEPVCHLGFCVCRVLVKVGVKSLTFPNCPFLLSVKLLTTADLQRLFHKF